MGVSSHSEKTYTNGNEMAASCDCRGHVWIKVMRFIPTVAYHPMWQPYLFARPAQLCLDDLAHILRRAGGDIVQKRLKRLKIQLRPHTTGVGGNLLAGLVVEAAQLHEAVVDRLGPFFVQLVEASVLGTDRRWARQQLCNCSAKKEASTINPEASRVQHRLNLS